MLPTLRRIVTVIFLSEYKLTLDRTSTLCVMSARFSLRYYLVENPMKTHHIYFGVKATELLNVCRICLRELGQDRESIFNRFENDIANEYSTHNEEDQLLRVVDIIILCASNISVNK